MPPKTFSERHASVEELSRALTMLTAAERLRLFARARMLAWGTEYTDPQELFNEAVKRALVSACGSKRGDERGRPWPIERVQFPAFLSGCMDSIADASRKSLDQTQTDRLEALAGENEDVDAVIHRAGRWNTDVLERLTKACHRQARDVRLTEHGKKEKQGSWRGAVQKNRAVAASRETIAQGRPTATE